MCSKLLTYNFSRNPVIRPRFQEKKFILAKSTRNTLEGLLKLKYKKNFEISLIFSIVLTFSAFRIGANFDIGKYLEMEENRTFEFLDIPQLVDIKEPPKLKMEQVIAIPPEPEEDLKSNELVKKIESLLAENQEEEVLDIKSDLSDNLITNSQISVSGFEVKIRGRRGYEGGSMNFGDRSINSDLLTDGQLDVGQTRRTGSRFVADNSSLDLESDSKNGTKAHRKIAGSEEPKLGISGRPEKVLSFSTSTIGTQDYKIWNKIIAELDRLNKGRYGKIPAELQRHRGGFLINLTFPDKTQHEIHWRNNGNVWIKVIGQSNRTTIEELRKAAGGLFRLSLDN